MSFLQDVDEVALLCYSITDGAHKAFPEDCAAAWATMQDFEDGGRAASDLSRQDDRRRATIVAAGCAIAKPEVDRRSQDICHHKAVPEEFHSAAPGII
jgi:hypothetical protein